MTEGVHFDNRSANRIRIFIVDDEPVIARTLALILQRSGFETLSFTSPMEALQTANERPPDLLISDVCMPQLSGIDLALKVRSLRPTCKILLFSGQAATKDILAKARESGHRFDFLEKPVHPSDLLRHIGQITAARQPQLE